jgi:hypothetical protein
MAGQSQQRVSERQSTEHRNFACESITKFRCVNQSGWRDRAKCLVTASRDRRGQFAGSFFLIYENPLQACNTRKSITCFVVSDVASVRSGLSREQMTAHLCMSTSETFTKILPSCLPLIGLRLKMLPVVLYGCETWSLTLREEYTQAV